MKILRLGIILIALLTASLVLADRRGGDKGSPNNPPPAQAAPAVRAPQSHGSAPSTPAPSTRYSRPPVSSQFGFGKSWSTQPTISRASTPSRGPGNSLWSSDFGPRNVPSRDANPKIFTPPPVATRSFDQNYDKSRKSLSGDSQWERVSERNDRGGQKTFTPPPPVNRDQPPKHDNGQGNWRGDSQWRPTPGRDDRGGQKDYNAPPRGNDSDRRGPGPGDWRGDFRPGNPPGHDDRKDNDRREWGRGDDHRGGNWDGHWRQPGPPPPDFHRTGRYPRDWDEPYHGRYAYHWLYRPLIELTILPRPPVEIPPLGSVIIGTGDTFLGVISRDTDDPDSIANPYGRFGSPDSPYCIFNEDGRWGSYDSPDSPWDSYATRPPMVYYGDTFRGYLSTNPNVYPRINPYWLIRMLDIQVR